MLAQRVHKIDRMVIKMGGSLHARSGSLPAISFCNAEEIVGPDHDWF